MVAGPALAGLLLALWGVAGADLTNPLIGIVRAGFMADAWGVSAAIWIGGLVCLADVIATGYALPRFWSYRSSLAQHPH